mgnify:CR=1 FL=1
MFEIVDSTPENAIIKVIGVGGGGGNAVEHMVKQNIEGVEFICANTDAQALKNLGARTLLQLGSGITRGLGAGANPLMGKDAALEDRDRIAESLSGSDMVFITAGMGGGLEGESGHPGYSSEVAGVINIAGALKTASYLSAGDEPLMLQNKNPGIDIILSESRRNGMEYI